MNYKIVTNQCNRWESFLQKFSTHEVYQIKNYATTISKTEKNIPFLLYFESDKYCALNVIVVQDIANSIVFKNKVEKNKYYDCATPYGYGGFVFEGTPDSEFWEKVEKCYQELNIVSEFIRYMPWQNNHMLSEKFYAQKVLGPTVYIPLDRGKDFIWNNLHSKNRNMIRKAKREGIVIKSGFSLELFSEFKQMYDETMIRDNATSFYFFPIEFYEDMYTNLKNNARIYYAEFDGKKIAMSIILHDNKNLHYHLSGSDFKYRSLAANNLLLYEVAIEGAEQGFQLFHLGGGVGSAEDGLYKFKKSFNKNLEDFQYVVGTKIYDEEKYEFLLNIRKEQGDFPKDSSFFPLYRA
jgi:hypothetical protein